MTKIFKQLARHWAACLAVAALLIVQAYCDLSLPDYTSKIVDVGIQQGGIESPVPYTVRDTTLQALELLMTEDEAALAAQWYSEPDADGLRYLSKDADTAAAELESAFTTPDVVLYMAAAQNAARVAGSTETVTPTTYDLDAVSQQFAAMAQAPGAREMLQNQLAGALSQLDGTVADNLASQAVLLVSLEYEAQGIAHDVQMAYLLRIGGQMLGLTLLMVAAAVAVGFIASRVSAAIGRDLRREVFSTVVGYSNAEIEKFSTASLKGVCREGDGKQGFRGIGGHLPVIWHLKIQGGVPIFIRGALERGMGEVVELEGGVYVRGKGRVGDKDHGAVV